MRNRTLILWLAAFLLGGTLGAWAQETAPQPLDVKLNIVAGQVKLTRVGKTLSDVLTTGVPLFPGDLIETMRESKAELVYGDGATMRIKPQTLLEVQPFSLKIFKGKMWHKFTKRGTEFVIDTPSLVAGIRGTVFDVAVTSRGKAILSVMEGKVQVAGKTGSRRKFLVPAGSSSHADPGCDPVPPYKFNLKTKNAEWVDTDWVGGDKSVDQLFLNYVNLKGEYGENDPRTVEAHRQFVEAQKAKSARPAKK